MKLFVTVVIFAISVIFFASAIDADTFKDEAAMRKFGDDFMNKIGSGDVAAAFEMLRPYSIMNDVDFGSAVNESNKQRQKFSIHYGPSAGYVFVAETKKGNTAYMLQYIEKTQKQALIWAFYFYKTKDGWVVDEFGWTDQLSVLFQGN